jgi:hypothetical protein
MIQPDPRSSREYLEAAVAAAGGDHAKAAVVNGVKPVSKGGVK